MQRISFRAPLAMIKLLNRVAKKMGKSRSYIICQAVTEYVQDLQDYEEVLKYKATYNPKNNVSFEAIKKKYNFS